MSSLVTNLNSSTAQEIVNWVTTYDGCVHTDDTTQLDSRVAKAVCIGLDESESSLILLCFSINSRIGAKNNL